MRKSIGACQREWKRLFLYEESTAIKNVMLREAMPVSSFIYCIGKVTLSKEKHLPSSVRNVGKEEGLRNYCEKVLTVIAYLSRIWLKIECYW